MSRKRRNTSSPEPDESPTKRRSISLEYDTEDSDYSNVNQRPQIDATTGQSGAFPGLGDDDELFYGPAADGIDYLRMVRSERKDIPELLTTIQPPTQHELDGGYWENGAYTAQPAVQAEQEETLSKTQLLYYDTLQKHFRLIRATMNCTPPLAEIEALGPNRPISFPSGHRAARDTWDRQISQQSPHPVQVACMDASSVFEVIKHMTRRMGNFMRASDDEGISRIGSWVWALLGKCPERGQLGSEEISDLRSFAQKAVEVGDWMDTKNGSDQTDSVDHDDDEDNLEDTEPQMTDSQETDSANVSAARLASTNHDGQDFIHNKKEELGATKIVGVVAKRRMLVDMILTVVGEVYGQRDLLEFRKSWQVETID